MSAADPTRYHIHATIEAIYQCKDLPDWWVHFEGSREALSFGTDRPDWYVGDKVHITFMKET
jgi:hypothetical protein